MVTPLTKHRATQHIRERIDEYKINTWIDRTNKRQVKSLKSEVKIVKQMLNLNRF